MEAPSPVKRASKGQERDASRSTVPSESKELEQKDTSRPSMTRASIVRPMELSQSSCKSPLELHQKCIETIRRYSASLRERQRKMERLSLVNAGQQQKEATPRTLRKVRNKFTWKSLVRRNGHLRKSLSPLQSMPTSLVSIV